MAVIGRGESPLLAPHWSARSAGGMPASKHGRIEKFAQRCGQS
jgi:hypothetical protein